MLNLLSEIELDINGTTIDIHNFYLIKDLFIDNNPKQISITLQRSFDDDGISNDWPTTVQLKFEKVRFFQIYISGEALTGISEIGFKDSGDHDLSWLKSVRERSLSDHTIVRLDLDSYLRIEHDEASVSVIA
jgi:hypothetical protein